MANTPALTVGKYPLPFPLGRVKTTSPLTSGNNCVYIIFRILTIV